MRNLNLTNPEIFRPARIASIGALIPVFFATLGITLANSAAPATPLFKNPIILLNCLVLITASILVFLPRLNNWGWNTKHFGVSLFNISSITLICLTPCLCIVFYSTLSAPIRILIFITCVAAHVIWCRRFIKIYKKVSGDSSIVSIIYEEEHDAIYYMQKIDKYILDKKYKFIQIPKGRYFIASNIFSFILLGFISLVKTTVGVPFIHVFLLINSLPISIMAAGLATKSWLVFYYYPSIIKRNTSKDIYVDMSSNSNNDEMGFPSI